MATRSLGNMFSSFTALFGKPKRDAGNASTHRVDGYAEARRIYRETNGPTPALRAMYKQYQANRVMVSGGEPAAVLGPDDQRTQRGVQLPQVHVR